MINKIVSTTVMLTMLSGQDLIETLDGDLIEVWDTGHTLLLDFVDPEKKDTEIIIDKSSNNNRHSFKNNRQIRKDLTLWEKFKAAGLFEPLDEVSGLRNQAQSDSLDMLGRRIRQDKPR